MNTCAMETQEPDVILSRVTRVLVMMHWLSFDLKIDNFPWQKINFQKVFSLEDFYYLLNIQDE